MKQPAQLWQLDALARRYNIRPSNVLGIVDDYTAFCLDQAVMLFAAGVQQKLDDIPQGKGKKAPESRKRKQDALLHKLLRMEGAAPQKFRDPAEALKLL